jgi:hypothetical protein
MLHHIVEVSALINRFKIERAISMNIISAFRLKILINIPSLLLGIGLPGKRKTIRKQAILRTSNT